MGRGPHKCPRAGSRAHAALERLHAIGGKTVLLDWMRALGYAGTIVAFERDVLGVLARAQLIAINGPFLSITGAGLDALGVPVHAPAPAAPALVAAPYTVADRPLNAARHRPRPALTREGALDFLKIPSLMCGARVPHKSVLAGDER